MAEAPGSTDRHMSDAEALMWNLEKDPHLLSTMANVTTFDRSPDFARLRRRMERAIMAVPRLRQRVVAGFGRMAPPEWRDDPDFDLDYHLRRTSLPSPATERDLFDLAARLAADPFDRSRPLWEFHMIDGLEGGRAAMVQKLHHTITDGEGGIRMSIQFIDSERDAPEPEPLADPEPAEPADTNLLAALAGTVEHNLRRQVGLARRTLAAAVDTAVHPSQLLSVPEQAVATARSLAGQLTVDPRRSPLWTKRSLRRRFDVITVSLDDAKRAAKALGGSINDFFVAGAVGGAGAYHRAAGASVDELRMAMPVSTRTKGSGLTNSFTPTRVLVPTTPDPQGRFDQVRERLTETKGDRVVGMYQALAGVVNLLPTSVLIRTARAQTETVDFTTSNLRAAPFDLFIGGALIEGNYPMGPLAGTAFNLTTMSYRGQLEMGLYTDTGAVEDPDLLLTSLRDSYDELLALG